MKATIRTKLLLGFSVIMALLVVGYAVTEYRLDRIQQATARIHEEWTEIRLSAQASSSLDETIKNLARFVISGDEKEKTSVRNSFQASFRSIEELAQFQHVEADEVHRDRLHRETELSTISSFKEDFAQLESTLSELLELSDPKEDTRSFLLFDRATRLSNQISANLAQFGEVAHDELNRSIRVARQEEAASDRILFASVLGMFLMGLAFSLLFSRYIVRSVGSLMSRSQQIGRGVFDYLPVSSSRDEIGELDRALQRMAANLRGLYGNLEDMLKRKDEEMQRTHSLAEIGQMVSAVAHDVRNPLQNIYMSVDTLRGEMGEDKGKMEILEEIDRSVNLLNRIVGELLDYSRPAHPRCATESIARLVENALAALTVELQNIHVDLDIEEESAAIFVDPTMMNRALVNIVANAADAMPNGGDLKIRSRFISRNGGILLTISIADTGHGISEEHLHRVHEPFFTTKSGGTGLGIPISKKMVEAHGGNLTIRSNAGRGTTVEMTLPAEYLAQHGQ
ncbi:MAG: hypothetical protein Kow0099_11990 [Candidatus Abyssubacteria bacterium]